MGKIKVRNFNAWHPELKPDERFIGYMHLNEFEQCEWETKRRGLMAYDVYGCKMAAGGYPVFVKLEELQAAKVELEDITFITVEEWTGPENRFAFQAVEELRFALVMKVRPESIPMDTWEWLLSEEASLTHLIGMPEMKTYYAEDNYNGGGALFIHTPSGEFWLHGVTLEMLSI